MTLRWYRWFAALAALPPLGVARAQQPAAYFASTDAPGGYYARVAAQASGQASLAHPYSGGAVTPATSAVANQPAFATAHHPAAALPAPTTASPPTARSGLHFPKPADLVPPRFRGGSTPPTNLPPGAHRTLSPLNGVQTVAWQQPRSFLQSAPAGAATPGSSYHAALLASANQPTLAPPQPGASPVIAGGAPSGGFETLPAFPGAAPGAVPGYSPPVDLGTSTFQTLPGPSQPAVSGPAAAPGGSWRPNYGASQDATSPIPGAMPYPGATSYPNAAAYPGVTAYPDPNISGSDYGGFYNSAPVDAAADWMQYGMSGGGCKNCGPWFASLSGLYMTRDAPNNVGLAFFNAVPQISVLNTEQAGYDWKGGFELRLGRTLGTNWALETAFWYLDPSGSTVSVRSDANDISSRLDTGVLAYQGVPMSDYYNNAHEQRINRTNDFQNLELNLWQQSLSVDPGGRWGMAVFSGVRWLRYRDMVEYGTAMAGAEFEDNDPTTQSWYHVRVSNQLIGWQIGARSQLYLGPRWRLFAVPRIGLMANVLSLQQDFCMVINNHSDKSDFAMLGQLDVGAAYQLFDCCSVFASYRGIGVAGVANADDNIARSLVSQPDMAEINSSGSLILHGLNAGVQFQF